MKSELNSFFLLQIIVTSKAWRPVHREIYNNRTRDYLIFGGPLDIAVAANTKFNVLLADRLEMSKRSAHNYKLRLILGMFRVQLKRRTRISIQLFGFARRNNQLNHCTKNPHHLQNQEVYYSTANTIEIS